MKLAVSLTGLKFWHDRADLLSSVDCSPHTQPTDNLTLVIKI